MIKCCVRSLPSFQEAKGADTVQQGGQRKRGKKRGGGGVSCECDEEREGGRERERERDKEQDRVWSLGGVKLSNNNKTLIYARRWGSKERDRL